MAQQWIGTLRGCAMSRKIPTSHRLCLRQTSSRNPKVKDDNLVSRWENEVSGQRSPVNRSTPLKDVKWLHLKDCTWLRLPQKSAKAAAPEKKTKKYTKMIGRLVINYAAPLRTSRISGLWMKKLQVWVCISYLSSLQLQVLTYLFCMQWDPAQY